LALDKLDQDHELEGVTMRAQLPNDDRQTRLRDAELRTQIAQLDAELRRSRERLHEKQRAVHNAAQVLAMARVERYLAAMEVAELADELEHLQGLQASGRQGEASGSSEPEGVAPLTSPLHVLAANSLPRPW
jgi:hypothetical protein